MTIHLVIIRHVYVCDTCSSLLTWGLFLGQRAVFFFSCCCWYCASVEHSLSQNFTTEFSIQERLAEVFYSVGLSGVKLYISFVLSLC